jgi:hypothetical protein
MKLFGINFNKKKPVDIQPPVEKGKIELKRAKPFQVNANVIDDNIKEERWVRTLGPVIYWGVDNKLPYRVSQLYKSSSIHSAIVNYKRDYLSTNYSFLYKKEGGSVADELKLQIFKSVIVSLDDFENFDDFVKNIALEIILFGNLFIKIRKVAGKVQNIEVVPSVKVRVCGDSITYKKSGYAVSNDWMNGTNYRIIPPYDPSVSDGEMMMVYQIKSPDYKFYGTPDWWSAYDAIEVLANIPYYHRQNILNGINLNGILTFYDYPKSEEERVDFENDIRSILVDGIKKTGGLMITDGTDPNLAPKYTKIDAPTLDKQFIQLFDDMEKIVCYSHNIAPAVMGTPTPGKLGATQEIEFLTAKFEEGMNGYKKIITDIINKLLSCSDLPDVRFYYEKVDLKNDFEK